MLYFGGKEFFVEKWLIIVYYRSETRQIIERNRLDLWIIIETENNF